MRMTLGRAAVFVATTACGSFAFLTISVVFFHGLNVEIGGFRLRSTTLEFPVIGLTISSLLLLVFAGKVREALLLIGSLLVAFFLAEGVLRFVDHPLSRPYLDYVRWYEPSDIFGHRMVPNFEGYGPLNLLVKTNSDGFRDREFTKEKKQGTLRVLGLGDSFTFGWGVADHESFLSHLEKLLRDATGKDVEVMNTGVPGWGLNQYYLYLKMKGIHYSPDFVILNYFVDDLPGQILETIQPREYYRPGLQYKGGFLHNLRVYNVSKSLSDMVRHKNRRTRMPYLQSLDKRREEWTRRKQQQYLLVEPPEEQRDQYNHLLEEYLRRLQGIAQDQEAHFIILFIPDIAQLHHPDLQYINEAVRSLSVRYDIPFADMTPIFEENPDPRTFYLWPMDPHTNALGHQKMAETLLQLICQSLRAVSCRSSGL